MAFFMLHLFVTTCSAAAQAPSMLDTAREFIATGEVKKAEALLKELITKDEQNSEAWYWLAESALSMEKYQKAQAIYTKLLQHHPEHTAARHRRWLAYLADAKDIKAARHRVRQEIKHLLAACANVRCRYIAYRGYKYLWDRKRRGHAMLQLVPSVASMAAEAEINQSVPGELLDEILQARRPLRGQLAKQFLRYYPRRRGIDLASRIYLQGQIREGLTPRRLHSLMHKHPDNRHLRLQATRWLIGKHDLARAEQALEEHKKLFALQSQNEKDWYADEAGWRQILAWEHATGEELYGRLAMARQQWQVAEQHFLAAAPAHLHAWRVWRDLARIYSETGRLPQAVDAWRKALTLGKPDPKAEKALRDLLQQQGQTATHPHRYFARQEGAPQFVDATNETGLTGFKSQRVAWGDWDNDGDADLLLDGPRVLRNDNGMFQDVTNGLGIDSRLQTTGGAWVDVDNDGWLDLWLYGRNSNHIYRNEMGAQFRMATDQIFSGRKFSQSTEASAWGDANNDGWLDLYTANYEKRGLERGMCFRDRLFFNEKGRLRDASKEMGVTTDAPLCGRGVMWADIDRDGDQDILVANYRVDRNLLWLNQGDRFIEAAGSFALRGRLRKGVYGNSVGFAIADVDGDQQQDIYVSNLAHPRYIDITDVSHLLLRTEKSYTDRTKQWGVIYEESSADPVFADFDNDGLADLYITSIYPNSWSRLYRNEGDLLRDISWISNSRVDDAWGVAVADYDNDGDLDLVLGRAQGVRLLRNTGPGGHWLQIGVRSPNCNRFGVGAQVRVDMDGIVQEQTLTIGRGTGSQDELVAHFGLGATSPASVLVEVRDLCGGEARDMVPVDRRTVLTTSQPVTHAGSGSTTLTP